LCSKEVTIIAVTKNHPFSAIEKALENNIFNIGENRVQETEKKIKGKILPPETKLHLIGHLQKNKVRKAVKIYDYIQTVDSLSLAKKIDKISLEYKKVQKILLQINIGNKSDRKGFLTSEIKEAAEEINIYKNICIKGIMIIPPLEKDQKKYLNYFDESQAIKKNIEKKIKTCKYLSMGMSNDYTEAIKKGATHIRIGTALFGNRQK
tara:strand:- start:591 stop:1211 length:621 start_codon:yes stop_codon:yes gene_type:complete